MPVPLLTEVFDRGLSRTPYAWTVLKIVPVIGIVYLLKLYFGGAKCTAERVMHGKVVIVTGGTAGIGASIVRELATRGAQIILLTHHELNDTFLVDYIEDLKTRCNNELIYAEQVDLSSLHSIRLFATKWVDNAPPRRLDMVILCANVMTPYWGISKTTQDGLEEEWMINYLSSFHLMSILSPALRAQPPDRDIRVLFSTCSSYIGGKLDLNTTERKTKSGSWSYGRSKLALMTFVEAFQKHLDSYTRPDKAPNKTRAFVIDPGFTRTPGTRRWLTGGSLIGLLFYMITWPIWWLVLKSPDQGAQSYLTAAMEAGYARGSGGNRTTMIKECREIESFRPDVKNEEIAKKLWEHSEKQVERLEKAGAIRRALEKKEKEEEGKEGAANGTTNAQKKTTQGSRRAKKEK